MTKLSKIHKEEIIRMIENREPISYIKSYCEGAGFDTTKYSSAVHIGEDRKITLRYRNINSYYYI